MSDAPVTVGTAGHVDHGKTALVRALTGRDTDRLPEEHRRGISVDLGFAPLELTGGRVVSLVDVPGHERFVRTMVAGATGIDMFVMCVAADDGVMPQTREHAAVLRHLGVTHGVVAVTKADAADPARAEVQVRELLPGVPVVITSARAGEGIDELRRAIADVAAALPPRSEDDGPARLHVDRSFSLRGIGTVVTGTLWAGSLGAGDAVALQPGGTRSRVRSVQVHDQPMDRAQAGQRVAVALTGIHRAQARRGDVLTLADSPLEATYRVDAALTLEPGEILEPGARVQVHHGTRESAARVVPLGGGRQSSAYVQLRLESPLLCLPRDRLVVRRVAPPATIGGAVVLDATPRRHGPSVALAEHLRRLERGEVPSQPPAAASPPPAPNGWAGVPAERLARVAEVLEGDGLEPRPDVRLARDLELAPAELKAALDHLVRDGAAVRVGPSQHFGAAALERAGGEVADLCRRQGSVTIASARDELSTSRKYAQAVLEYLDRTRVTRRVGDEHVLRGSR